MTDREMLELAAKAAGLKFFIDGYDEILQEPAIEEDGFPVLWNPLTDDGDALRLAVALGIEFKKPSRSRSVGRVVQAWFNPDGNPNRSAISHISVTVDGDKLSATRRAITMAAAEIGKSMP